MGRVHSYTSNRSTVKPAAAQQYSPEQLPRVFLLIRNRWSAWSPDESDYPRPTPYGVVRVDRLGGLIHEYTQVA